ncbi:unnamed protein product [Anisakis simplex]|uniref:DUF3835 domain-containing protein n=1 Tax=Anisakis simplex TaxID=6269 RepID=A0A0M3K940_ANISI|nr:unnamed protein product [Anisakis simplex]
MPRGARLLSGVRRKREVLLDEAPQSESLDRQLEGTALTLFGPIAEFASKEDVNREFADSKQSRTKFGTLSALSDEQLQMLANIVQNKLDQYDPTVPIESYRVVELPPEMFVNSIANGRDGDVDGMIGDDDDGSYDERFRMPLVARMPTRIPSEPAVVVIPEDELQNLIDAQQQQDDEQFDDEPQLVITPNEEELSDVVPIDEALADELELRERIADLADILNERANRGM